MNNYFEIFDTYRNILSFEFYVHLILTSVASYAAYTIFYQIFQDIPLEGVLDSLPQIPHILSHTSSIQFYIYLFFHFFVFYSIHQGTSPWESRWFSPSFSSYTPSLPHTGGSSPVCIQPLRWVGSIVFFGLLYNKKNV